MKRIILIVCIISLLTGCISFNYQPGIRFSMNADVFVKFSNQKERAPELEKLYDEAIVKYGGPGNYIIQYMKKIAEKYCRTPYIAYYTWISDSTRSKVGEYDFNDSLAFDVSIGIHETVHQFSGSAAYMDSEYSTSVKGRLSYIAPSKITSVYLQDWGLHHVLHTKTIPASMISDFIQDKKLMEDSRYNTYINDSYHVAQSEGIYGLLDEYHAYHYSLITSVNIAKEKDLDLSKKVESGKSYTSSFSDMFLSFLQFSIYIFTYFRTAEQMYPDVYAGLMNNHVLLEAIVRIHDESEVLYEEYLKLLIKDAKKMNDKKYVFQDENERLLKEYQLPENQKILARIRELVTDK